MILDCSKYVGPCKCGREHTLETKKVVVEYNALDKFDQYMDEVGLSGKRAVIYDTNTYNLPTLRHVRADQEIVLNAEGLHSEKGMIEDMMRQLDHPDVIVAVGSGTIMDFGRYPAYHLGIPFVAVPTLASSDGFTANICSIIIDGQKKSIPMQAAALVVCDLNVVSGAPLWLTVSGISDILAKYISLADWKIAHLVSGEYYCPMVADLAQEALTIMRKAADDMAAGGKPDFEAMTMAQMISGLTMQLLNHSRAASGAEHLMAHLVEMKPPRFENAHGMHGQCVGVGTYLCAKEYHYLASLPTPKAKPFEPLSRAWVDEKFGPLADGIMKENENDVLGTFDPQNIVDHWDEIRAIIAEIPSAEELAALCEKLGAFYKPEQIGIDPALSEDMLSVSAAIRNRLTLIRMRRGIAVVNICRDVRKQLAADLIRLAVKNDEVDGHIVRKQEIADSVDRRPERQILRKSVDTGGDERKRDRRTAVLQRERKRRPVAGSEQLSLSVRAAAPARPDRVDDVPARQSIALRELRVPSRAAAERFALCQQLRTGGAVDASVHPTAAV